ncbi:MAG: two-component system, chemotaxis family, chemotaxis protein CheY, partial [Alphaproteobacteria bacterium]|nr:two-component system, chemotaxis family, chemotaxis protein CheY [Alphaproteobacteria bacterium]
LRGPGLYLAERRPCCNGACSIAGSASPDRGSRAMSMGLSKGDVEFLIHGLRILLIDDNQYMRKIVRNLLVNLGIREVYEATDGIAGLDAIRTVAPDIVIIDWELPLLNGAEFVRIVRSPGVFPMPDIPIIMLTSHGERWRVVEAVRIGVNEYLRKPVSAQALLDRFISILAKPRATVQVGDYYGPEPRKDLPELLRPVSVAPAPDGTALN